MKTASEFAEEYLKLCIWSTKTAIKDGLWKNGWFFTAALMTGVLGAFYLLLFVVGTYRFLKKNWWLPVGILLVLCGLWFIVIAFVVLGAAP